MSAGWTSQWRPLEKEKTPSWRAPLGLSTALPRRLDGGDATMLTRLDLAHLARVELDDEVPRLTRQLVSLLRTQLARLARLAILHEVPPLRDERREAREEAGAAKERGESGEGGESESKDESGYGAIPAGKRWSRDEGEANLMGMLTRAYGKYAPFGTSAEEHAEKLEVLRMK